jgi:phosphoglycerate-specific signal transduction histidine kinase
MSLEMSKEQLHSLLQTQQSELLTLRSEIVQQQAVIVRQQTTNQDQEKKLERLRKVQRESY